MWRELNERRTLVHVDVMPVLEPWHSLRYLTGCGRFTTPRRNFTEDRPHVPRHGCCLWPWRFGRHIASSRSLMQARSASPCPRRAMPSALPGSTGTHSDLLGNYSVVPTASKYNAAQQLSADSYSGSSEYGHLDVWFRGMFSSRPGIHSSLAKVTVNGRFRLYKTGTVSMQVSGAGAPAQASTVWGKDGFQHAVVFVDADTDLDDGSSRNRSHGIRIRHIWRLCLPDDPLELLIFLRSASILLSSMTIQALVATTVPAVPAAEGVWLAPVG